MPDHSRLSTITSWKRAGAMTLTLALSVSLSGPAVSVEPPTATEVISKQNTAPVVYEVPRKAMKMALSFCVIQYEGRPARIKLCKRIQRIKEEQIILGRMRKRALRVKDDMHLGLWDLYYSMWVDPEPMHTQHGRFVKALSNIHRPTRAYVKFGVSWWGTYIDTTHSRKMTRVYANKARLEGVQVVAAGICAAVGPVITAYGAAFCAGGVTMKTESLKTTLLRAKRTGRCIKIRHHFGSEPLTMVGNIVASPKVVDCRR